MSQLITLISNDQVKMEIEKKNIVQASGLIKDMVEENNDGENIEIPLPNVNAECLKLIINYANHHVDNKAQEIEKPLKGPLDEYVSDWDYKFISDLSDISLTSIIMASNYMNMRELLDLSCAKIATIIRGKTPQEIRDLLNIENDFTPEEEKEIEEENKWCEE